MKIFICEHTYSEFTPGNDLSSAVEFRADILLHALLADISRIETLEVSIARDTALGFLDVPAGTNIIPLHGHNTEEIIDACFEQADAVWPLAPESNGLLESISRKTVRHKKVLLGSSRDAVHLTGSKYRTSHALRASGIPVVSTFRPPVTLPLDAQAWVVKPDDGAGCSNTYLFSHSTAATEWIAAQQHGDYVLQPYLAGRPCSLSLLCGNDAVYLLSCNEQRVAVSNNQFHYMGSVINSFDDSGGALERMARQVVAAIPGLWGYVGIDFIITDQGPVVLEVNPRMTVSHAGLHASIGANPAQMLFDMLHTGNCGATSIRKSRQISVDLNACQHDARARD